MDLAMQHLAAARVVGHSAQLGHQIPKGLPDLLDLGFAGDGSAFFARRALETRETGVQRLGQAVDAILAISRQVLLRHHEATIAVLSR
jgi:hypothetical protein